MAKTRAARLETVIDEARLLFHRLSSFADGMHADLELTVGQRALLEALARGGPQTVPTIARARGVSRQHIQTLANGLAERGLVTTCDNPAHRRSPLLTLTRAGTELFQETQRREASVLENLARGHKLAELEATALTLATLREQLEALASDRGDEA